MKKKFFRPDFFKPQVQIVSFPTHPGTPRCGLYKNFFNSQKSLIFGNFWLILVQIFGGKLNFIFIFSKLIT